MSVPSILHLTAFEEATTLREFERAIDGFVELVLDRLQKVGIEGSELQVLWREIRDERSDPETSRYRKLEAQLGFEADEAPEPLLQRLLDIRSQAGDEAVSEIALACSGPDPAAALTAILERVDTGGVEGTLCIPAVPPPEASLPPWERGWALARATREALGITADPIDDDVLREALGTNIGGGTDNGGKVPAGIVVRDPGSGSARIHFRRRNLFGRRFEAARFIADAMVASSSEPWLVETDSNAARQKLQRFFAAEFLCPIAGLTEFMGDDLSGEAMEEAGEHFRVSPLMVRSQLANHHFIPKF